MTLTTHGHRAPRFPLLAAVAFALVVSACSPSATEPPATTSAAPPTTVASTVGGTDTAETTMATSETTSETGSAIDDDVAAMIQEEIGELIAVTERVRGLEFIVDPEVTVVTGEEMAARIRADLEEEIDADELAVEDRFYRMLGLIEPNQDLMTILVDLYSEQVAGFYDGETGELVVAAAEEGLSPFTKSVAVHELVHALTDQHFEFFEYWTELVDSDQFDAAAAVQGLIEGDATYFQVVYIQQLEPAELLALSTEALGQDFGVLDDAPEFLREALEFPYTSGEAFVRQLVSEGGIAAVDQAYLDPPTTTEHLLHGVDEPVRQVSLPILAIPGLEELRSGVLGEEELRLMFTDSATKGLRTQIGAGWGGDDHRLLYDEDDIVFVYRYLGDTEEDTIEVTEAFIDLARIEMLAGQGESVDAGLLFPGEPYVWIDRTGDGLLFIAATDAELGAQVRALVSAG